MAYLKEHTPDGMEELVVYFDSVCVPGTFRRVQQGQVQTGAPPPLRVRNIPPRHGNPSGLCTNRLSSSTNTTARPEHSATARQPIWTVHQETLELHHHHCASGTFHHGTATHLDCAPIDSRAPPPPLRVRNIPPRHGNPSGLCTKRLWRDGIGRATPVRAGMHSSFEHQHPPFWTAVDMKAVRQEVPTSILRGASEAHSNPLPGPCS